MPIGLLEAETARCVALQDGNLMAQSNDLGLLRGAGPKRRTEQSEKGDQNRTHRETTMISRND